MELDQNQISTEFELRWKIVGEIAAWFRLMF